MNVLIRNLCVIGILSGLVISAMPDGGVRQTAGTFSICVCVLLVVNAFKVFDFEVYASQLAKYREAEYVLADTSTEAVDRLNRSVIENECSSYIVHEAAEAGISLVKVSVSAEWDVSGYWMPYSAVIYGKFSKDVLNTVECDLGIPGERVTWIN